MKSGIKSDPAYTALVEGKLQKIWQQAKDTPLGISIQTSDRDGLKRQLYIFRRKVRDSGDTSLDYLKITHGPEKDSKELWILPGDSVK